MAQHHFAVFYDTESKIWGIDGEAMSGYFPHGSVWNGDNWVRYTDTPELEEADDKACERLLRLLENEC